MLLKDAVDIVTAKSPKVEEKEAAIASMPLAVSKISQSAIDLP